MDLDKSITRLPADTLGADLIWWRSSHGWSTNVTLFWSRFQQFADTIHLQALLFDRAGQCVATWRIGLPAAHPILIDSTAPGPWQGHGDGMLALYACTDGPPSEAARKKFHRLYPLVGWHGPLGEIASLHSDQVIRRGRDKVQAITEIVAIENDTERNALVILNGEEHQEPGALALTFTNADGERMDGSYMEAMSPFEVHRIALREIAPGLGEFARGQPFTVSGRFESHGLFTRPYVETTGARYGIYHAGDVYAWAPLPHFVHALVDGEVNPMAVVHDGSTRTIVNLLHSHGDLEDDVAVDARLYDLQGRCIAQRPSWQLARRHGLSRADVADLLPDPSQPFRGHIALSFRPLPGQPVPRRLQALLEYRADASIAHVMAWSDEWNSAVRLARRDRRDHPALLQSYFRVVERTDCATGISITNAGHPGYARSAQIALELHGPQGLIAKTSFELAPYATRMAPVLEIFPNAREQLSPGGIGLLIASSESDLANVAFTRSSASGALAAEHFLPLQALGEDGRWLVAAGR